MFFLFAAFLASISRFASSLFLVLCELDLLFFPNPSPVSLFAIYPIIHYFAYKYNNKLSRTVLSDILPYIAACIFCPLIPRAFITSSAEKSELGMKHVRKHTNLVFKVIGNLFSASPIRDIALTGQPNLPIFPQSPTLTLLPADEVRLSKIPKMLPKAVQVSLASQAL